MTDVTALPEAERRSEAVQRLFPGIAAAGGARAALPDAGAAAHGGDLLDDWPGERGRHGARERACAGTNATAAGGSGRARDARGGSGSDIVSAGQALVYLDTETAAAHLEAAGGEPGDSAGAIPGRTGGEGGCGAGGRNARAAGGCGARRGGRRAGLEEGSMIFAPMDRQVTRLDVMRRGEPPAGADGRRGRALRHPLVVETTVANTDVGRVKIGQPVRIKVIPTPTSATALWKAKSPPSPPTRSPTRPAAPPTASLSPQPTKRDPLRLGLSATAEIVTTRRRIIGPGGADPARGELAERAGAASRRSAAFGQSHGLRRGYLPEPSNAVGVERGIYTDQRHLLHQALRDQHPVEGVSMVEGEEYYNACVPSSNRITNTL